MTGQDGDVLKVTEYLKKYYYINDLVIMPKNNVVCGNSVCDVCK